MLGASAVLLLSSSLSLLALTAPEPWARPASGAAPAAAPGAAPAASPAARPAATAKGSQADTSAALALFQKNLDAIKRRDREAYLSCYLHAGTLARTGFEGMQMGYDSLAKETGDDWPDLFEGIDLRLVPIRPGLIYGTYRYRVRYGAREDSGISERF